MGNNQWGILCCLLAGCVVQPTATDPRTDLAVASAAALPALATPRIGLEFLAPENDDPTANVRVEATDRRRSQLLNLDEPTARRAPKPVSLRDRIDVMSRRHTWTLDASDLMSMPDPVARETLYFLEDFLDEDRRSAEREVRVPFFDWQHHEATDDPMLTSEFTLQTARDEWIHDHGPRLLQRPLQRMLKRLPVARDVEVAVDDWRSDNVPFSEPYRQAHGDQRNLGRLSLRLRSNDWTDPVEVFYVRSGVRIGTSQNYGKVSWELPLTEKVRLQMRGRREYDGSDFGWRCDLIYQHSPRTSINLSAGDDLEFLSTSSIFSLFDSPMDGEAGIVLYAVHVF
ncbi:MAG: hypothetical protein H6838_11630 [Planctomycetes bacterium]|nr:hypothetical protein [Planctomycetota bacterium]